MRVNRAAAVKNRMALKKPDRELSYDPISPLLGIYPRELQAGSQTPMFLATLFITAKRWAQPKHLLTDKGTVVCPYDGILFSLEKKLSSDTRFNMDEP